MKKNTFSRGLALLLCLSMILGFVPGGLFGGRTVVNAVVSDEATDVTMQLRNGSFEELGDNNLPKYWKVVGAGIETVANDRYSGNTALKFTANGDGASIQQIIPVKGGETVKLEAWGKQLTAPANYDPSSKIYLGFQNDQGDWVPDGRTGAVAKAVARTSEWEKSELEVVIPEGTTKLLVEVLHDSNKDMKEAGETYSYVVDDVVLTFSSNNDAAEDSNLVPNGDFEASDTEYTSWTTSHPAKTSVVTNALANATNALKMTNSGSGHLDVFTGEIPVVGGVDYEFSVRHLKDASVEGQTKLPHIFVFWYKADGTAIDTPNISLGTVSDTEWQTAGKVLTAPAEAATAKIRFGIDNNAIASFFFDDVVVIPIPEPVFADSFDAYIDGVAGAGPAGWAVVDNNGTPNGNHSDVTCYPYYTGRTTVQFQSRPCNITSQEFDVVPGYAYTVSFETYKGVNNTNYGYGEVHFEDAAGNPLTTSKQDVGMTVQQWATETMVAVAPAGAAKAYLVFGITENGRDFALDNVVVTKSAEPAKNFPLNGDFEASDVGYPGWSYAGGTIALKPGEGVDGSNALYYEDADGRCLDLLANEFPVVAGRTYKFSMMLRGAVDAGDNLLIGNTGVPRVVIWMLKASEIGKAVTNDTKYAVVYPSALTKDWQLLEKEVEITEGVVSVRIQIDSGSATNHAYAYIDNVTFVCAHKSVGVYTYNGDATCTANGTETGTCADCGEIITREAVGTEHVQTRIPYNAATPLATGNIEYYICSCGNWYEDAACTKLIADKEDVNLPMTDCTNHEADEWISDGNATCTEDGTKSAKCKHCRTPMQETDVGSKHTQTYHEEIPASEKAAGTKAHWECSCGLKYFDEDCMQKVESDADLVIPRLSCDHVGLQTTYDENATCGADGTETGHCEVCDEDVTVPAPGTKHTQTYVPSTATTAAYYACSCGNKYYDAACTKPANNINLNFSFEEVNGDSPVNWTDRPNNNITVVTPPIAPNGKNVLQIAGGGQSTVSLNLSVEVGKTYQLKVMAKDLEGKGTMLDLRVEDANNQYLILGRTTTDGSGIWKLYTSVVTVPENADHMYVELWTSTSTIATTLIDSIVVEEVINETDKDEPDATEPTEPETEPTEPETEPTEPETEPTEPEETEPVETKPSEIVNGDFEDVTEDNKVVGWIEYSFPGADIEVVDEEGNKVVKFVADAAAGFAANIFRTELAVENGTALTVELMSKLLSGSGDAYVAVFFYDENGVMIPATMTYLVAIATTEDWAATALTLNVPEGAVTAAIEIGNALNQTISFLVDDVTVTKGDAVEEPEQPETEPSEPETPDEAGIDLNWSFENLTEEGIPANWRVVIHDEGAFKINTTDVHDGKNAVQITAAAKPNFVQSTLIPTKEGDTYELTLNAKVLSNAKAVYCGIWASAGDTYQYVDGNAATAVSITSAEWTEYKVTWNYYPGSANIWIEFGNNSGTTADYLIDDITLKINGKVVETIKNPDSEDPDETEPAAPTTIFSDGFEDDLSKWEKSHGHVMHWIPDPGHNPYAGNRVLLMQDYATNLGHTITSNDIYVVPGETYTLTYQVMDHWGYIGSSIGSEVKMIFVDASGNVLETVTKPAASEEGANVAEWTEKTVEAVAPADAAILRVEFNTVVEKKDVIYLVDELTVYGVEGTEPEAPTEPAPTEPAPSEPEAPSTPTEPSDENNLLVNGEFETGVDSWGGHTNMVKSVDTDSHSGDKCMQFTDDSANYGYYVSQKVAVTAGKTYVLSAWAKKVDGSDSGYMGVYGLDDANVAVSVASTGEWAYYKVEITIPDGYSEAVIEIGAHGRPVTSYLIDQVVFAEK